MLWEHEGKMPKVYNKYHGDAPKDAVYVGRGSPYGNPFSHMKNTTARFQVATREEAIERHIQWLFSLEPSDLREIKQALKGKDLVCFCAPKPCHGDVLLRIANEE
jgi:hypothetical protein